MVTINKEFQKPIVQNDKIVVADVMNVNITLDKRVFEEDEIENFMIGFNEVCENPEKF